MTFGDFLRAVLTSEMDFDPTDQDGVHDSWMQAFRHREILPDDAAFFSQDALRWKPRTGPPVMNLPFGGPLGLSYEDRRRTAKALTEFIDANRALLSLDETLPYRIPSFHPLYRVDRSGSMRWDLVVEIVQTRPADGPDGFPVRGGTTLIISSHSTGGGGRSDETFLRYVISKPLTGDAGKQRVEKQTAFLNGIGLKPTDDGRAMRINFALLHGVDPS